VAAGRSVFLFWGKGAAVAGTVTALTFQKRNPDRVSVYLDGKFAFGLAALDAAQLRRGQFLSDGDIVALQELGLRSKAYDRAVRFLAVRPRSTQEVRQNLRRYRPHRKKRGGRTGRSGRTGQAGRKSKFDPDEENAAPSPPDSEEKEPDLSQEGVSPELIEWVVEKLTVQGYLDDRAFAQFWIEQRNQFKPMAPRAIRYELRGKGVAPEIIETLVAEQVDPTSAAIAAARTRSQRWRQLDYDKFRQKMAGFLQRRGFSWSAAQEAIEITWQEIQEETEW